MGKKNKKTLLQIKCSRKVNDAVFICKSFFVCSLQRNVASEPNADEKKTAPTDRKTEALATKEDTQNKNSEEDDKRAKSGDIKASAAAKDDKAAAKLEKSDSSDGDDDDDHKNTTESEQSEEENQAPQHNDPDASDDS